MFNNIEYGEPMPYAKQQVKAIVESLPEDLTVDQVMEELRFRLLVDETLRELDNPREISRAEVDRRASRWLQK